MVRVTLIIWGIIWCFFTSVVFGSGIPDALDSCKTDKTELMWAAANGDLIKVQSLVADKADIHAKTKNGFNALYYAVAFKHEDVVGCLLNAGADPKSVNSFCKTREDLHDWMKRKKADKIITFDDKFTSFKGYYLPPELRYYMLIKYFFKDF